MINRKPCNAIKFVVIKLYCGLDPTFIISNGVFKLFETGGNQGIIIDKLIPLKREAFEYLSSIFLDYHVYFKFKSLKLASSETIT